MSRGELVRKIERGRHRRRVRAVEGAGQNASRGRRSRRLGAIRLLMERLTGLSPASHASKQWQTKSQSITVFFG